MHELVGQASLGTGFQERLGVVEGQRLKADAPALAQPSQYSFRRLVWTYLPGSGGSRSRRRPSSLRTAVRGHDIVLRAIFRATIPERLGSRRHWRKENRTADVFGISAEPRGILHKICRYFKSYYMILYSSCL